MWYIYVMEYCSAIKNKILIYATTQMNLEKLCQVKESRANDCVLYDSICMEFPEKKYLQKQKTDQWLAGAGRKDCKHAQENFGELMEMDCDDYCTTLDLLKHCKYITYNG